MGTRGRLLPLALGIALIALLALGAGCSPSHPMSTFDAAGPVARSQLDLFYLIFWVAVVVFVGVEGVLILAIVRFRRRPGQGIPEQIHGNTRLEIAWTVAPVLVLAIIVVPTISTIFTNATPPPGEDVLEITVTGHQWWWEFEYPTLGVLAANELHIPVGRPVNLTLISEDVIHSFWAPKLGGKRDIVPSLANTLWLQADRPGDYYGQCAELCGIGHANMRFRVIADEPEEFAAWVAAHLEPASAPTNPGAIAGQQLFMEGKPCAVCHTVAGTEAQGTVGPDLTHVGSRGRIAAGILDNTRENLDRWLADPDAIKPGVKMPNLNLTQQERADLVEYLRGLQ